MSKNNEGNGEIQLPPVEQVEQGYVTLPYNYDQFKDFIRSLLGSPQTIGKTIDGTFEIDITDIRNLYQLIIQRVTQQNDGVLASFIAKIIYSDNSSIELNTWEELQTYNEIRPITSHAIHLTWDFVVKFQDKRAPEKQRIQVSFIASGQHLPVIDDDLPLTKTQLFARIGGLISFRIEHTARTWGSDIEALLTNHINSLLKTPPGLQQFIRNHLGKISLGIGILFFLTIAIGAFLSIQRFTSNRIIEMNKLIENNNSINIEDVNEKVNYIATLVTSGELTRYYFAGSIFLIIGTFLSIIFTIWTVTALSAREPSFILLTKESYKDKEKALSKYRRGWLSFTTAAVLSIITGIVSNFIFNWLIS